MSSKNKLKKHIKNKGEIARSRTKKVEDKDNYKTEYISKIKFTRENQAIRANEDELSLIRDHIGRVCLILLLELVYIVILTKFFYVNTGIYLGIHRTFNNLSIFGFILLLFVFLACSDYLKKLRSIVPCFFIFINLIAFSFMYFYFIHDSDIGFQIIAITSTIFIPTFIFEFLSKNYFVGYKIPILSTCFSVIVLGFMHVYFENPILQTVILALILIILSLYNIYTVQKIKMDFLYNIRNLKPENINSRWSLAVHSSVDLYMNFIGVIADVLILMGFRGGEDNDFSDFVD